jgi:hypothetical protein
MSSIGAALLKSLAAIERPGDFCVGGYRDILMPTIDVEGVGRIALPLLAEQAKRLVAVAEAAPYGRGEATVLDRDVRRTWQIDAGKIRIGGRHWEKTLGDLVVEAARGLGVDGPVTADLYKLLLYDAGSFFIDHRDTEKAPGMFATLVIVLPSVHRGGELVVRHLDRAVTLDLRPEESSSVGFAAFYADCVHEIRPVTAGYRPTLVYNLRFPGAKRSLSAPDYRAERRQAAAVMRQWAAQGDEPDKLIFPLEHAYTPAELSFATLKGADAGVASVLVEAAAEADCDVHLALVSIAENGPAERRGGRWGEDVVDFEVVEVDDRDLVLSHWRRPDGGDAGFGEFPFEEAELCPSDAFDDLEPDEEYFHEATGNEGASFERTYCRAGLVLWPKARRLAVLNQAGLGATLPHLADLTGRWEAGGRDMASPLRQEAEELSAHMLSSWPRARWRPEGDTNAGRMLDLQARLGSAARIESFLSEVSAAGHYALGDNEAMVRAAAILPRERATTLLEQVIRANAADHLGACGDLLSRCVAARVGEVAQVGAALVDVLPGDPARQPKAATWQRAELIEPSLLHDVIGATSRIDPNLAARAFEQVLAWPKIYPPDRVLVPAALLFAKEATAGAWPAVERLRAACLDHLRRRIALPLEPPRDWVRPNTLECACAECRALGAFLADPAQRQWRLKAAELRRRHVEHSVKSAACDVHLATERRGSPHSLIATKNQASYERRVIERRSDLAQVAALGG